MERKQNEGTEKIMIKVAQTIFVDIAWLTDCFCSRFFFSMLQKLLTRQWKVNKVVSRL